MQQTNKLKIFNDPVYGFVTIPNALIFDIIEHRYFQRLRRITQMGLSNMVYPGANHTRFHHAIGCMYLMQKAVRVLRAKNVAISEEEENALYIAILLHDIGHGAFSHALEHSIVSGVSHEFVSLQFMKKLNQEFDNQLSLAIAIFQGNHPKTFLCQLISSQLDIDRLDYLRRDSFFTGVAEGNISSERLIAMMNVKKNELVIDQKGIYSVEKFIIARRLMYWQVYLHKTSLVAENLLVKILQRAKELTKNKIELPCSRALQYFLHHPIHSENFTDETLEVFSTLDDYDVLLAVKEWVYHKDSILSKLSQMLINRKLLKVAIQEQPFTEAYRQDKLNQLTNRLSIPQNTLHYFLFGGTISNLAYNPKYPIKILTKKGALKDIAKASDQLNLQALSKPVVKYFYCYPKKFVLQ